MSDLAILKLSYEIKTRKREFLTLCANTDKQMMTRLSIEDMGNLLDNFTCFLNREEKDEILKKFAVNNQYVNYMNIANLNYQWKVSHQDEFLLFLNKLRERPELQYLNVSARRMASVLNLSPLMALDYQMSEENFMKKICKLIVDKCEDFDGTFDICDFDHDNSFTIGEFNKFLERLTIDMYIDDLIFFFEKLNPTNGRLDRESIRTYIQEMSKSKYSKLELNKDLNIVVSKEEEKEQETIRNISEKNIFINVIKESLTALGKVSLMRSLGKYLELISGRLLIELTLLEKAYMQLGFGIIPELEINNFKFLILRNKFASRVGKRILVDIESLFEYISEYYGLNNNTSNKNSNDIINDINSIFFKEIADKLKESVFHYDSQNNIFEDHLSEIEFRKRFYNKFGFIDHSFLDNFVDYSKEVGRVDINQWVNYSFNILFMGFIKYFDQLGLMIDYEDRMALNTIYNKIESKAFPNDMQVKSKIIKLSDTQNLVLKDEGEKIDLNVIQTKIPLFIFKDKARQAKKKEIIIKPKEDIKEFNPNDTVTHVPKLYNLCANYLKQRFGLESVNLNIINNLGICKIFRDHLALKGLNLKNDIGIDTFIDSLGDLLDGHEFEFIKYYSSRFKNGFNEINVQYFFSNIEKMLIEFHKINNFN